MYTALGQQQLDSPAWRGFVSLLPQLRHGSTFRLASQSTSRVEGDLKKRTPWTKELGVPSGGIL